MPEAPAAARKPGVNELRYDGKEWNGQDQARILASVKTAKEKAPYVIVYQHNHYWAEDMLETPPWMKEWARRCIDAGATIFVALASPGGQGDVVLCFDIEARLKEELDIPVFHDDQHGTMRLRLGKFLAEGHGRGLCTPIVDG